MGFNALLLTYIKVLHHNVAVTRRLADHDVLAFSNLAICPEDAHYSLKFL